MPIAAQSIIRRCVETLQDTTSIRWPVAELVRYLNDGQREIIVHRPDAMVTNAAQALVAGSRQAIPSNGTKLIDVVRNTGGTTCLMTGWPGVSFVTGSQGRQVGAPAARQGTPAVVSLAPGASAEALLQVAEAGDFAPCTTTSVRGLRIYPPNQRDAVFVALPTKACAQTSAQQLTVRPVVLRG